MSILSLAHLGNGYASVHISYGQASTYCPRHTYYVIVFVFVCPYVRTALAVAYESNSVDSTRGTVY